MSARALICPLARVSVVRYKLDSELSPPRWDFNQPTSTSRDDHRRFNEIRPGDSYGGRNDESRFSTRSEDSAAARRPPDDERGNFLL